MFVGLSVQISDTTMKNKIREYTDDISDRLLKFEGGLIECELENTPTKDCSTSYVLSIDNKIDGLDGDILLTRVNLTIASRNALKEAEEVV
jgi:hypothetical protein